VEVRPSATGRCPEASYSFLGTVRTNGAAGSLELRWRRPDGESTELRTVPVRDGQRLVDVRLDFTYRGDQPLEGDAELLVTAPETDSATQAVTYTCSDRGAAG
jgi:hypothetical protein